MFRGMPYPIVKPLRSIHYTSKISAPYCTDVQVMSSPVFSSLDDIYCICFWAGAGMQNTRVNAKKKRLTNKLID